VRESDLAETLAQLAKNGGVRKEAVDSQDAI
jgi:hypothetical protein